MVFVGVDGSLLEAFGVSVKAERIRVVGCDGWMCTN